MFAPDKKPVTSLPVGCARPSFTDSPAFPPSLALSLPLPKRPLHSPSLTLSVPKGTTARLACRVNSSFDRAYA